MCSGLELRMCGCGGIFVFFFKQKTAYEMRISDWSSDVCSSDLSCTAGVINVDGDAAHASWSVTEQLRFRDKEDLSCCFGVYEDRLVRTSDGWRFARRRFVPFYRGSIPSTGKLYREPAFENTFDPWPFSGRPLSTDAQEPECCPAI